MPPKNKDQEFKEFIEKANDNLSSQIGIPGGIATLLDIPNRKTLPDIPKRGRPSLLYDIVHHNPETYAQYITYVKMGAFFHTAAEAVGMSEITIAEWGAKGRKDFNEGTDSYYARFYQDVRRAVAHCRVVREQAIAIIDPKKWLALGPGKIFGNQWSEKDKNTDELEGPDVTEIPFTAEQIFLEEEIKEGTGVRTRVIELDENTEEETLRILEDTLALREKKEVE